MAEDKIVLNETNYPYPRQRVCGLFLMGVGITMALSTLLGSKEYPNAFIFVIGYALSMFGIMFNKKVRNKFSIGEPTALQQKASDFAVIFIAVAAPVIGMSLSGTGNYRMIWLLILLAVGIHFLPFVLIHGKLMLLLAILLIINSSVGLYFSNTPFAVFGAADAIIKIFIGIMLYKISPKK